MPLYKLLFNLDTSMEMRQLNDLLPPEQWETYWTILGEAHEELENDKEYVIFEHYCINPRCDCQKLVAAIYELGPDGEPHGKSVAVIDYDWSSSQISCLPALSKKSPKNKLALNVLTAYKKHIHEDEYQYRIRNQYTKVKEATLKKTSAAKPDKNIGRNNPCSCGSNKKYKKCCLKN